MLPVFKLIGAHKKGSDEWYYPNIVEPMMKSPFAKAHGLKPSHSTALMKYQFAMLSRKHINNAVAAW